MITPSSATKTDRCSTCLYWRLQRPKEGLCLRHAPGAAGRETVAHWPQTHSEQWCGDHLPTTAARDITNCAGCRFWSRPPNGFEPEDRNDKLASWWAEAGLCCRRAPEPSSDPGPRAYWPATHPTDNCGDGRAKTPRQRGDH